MVTSVYDNGSFWFDSLDELEAPEVPDALPDKADVVIVGAGFTGLWTAYYLMRSNPGLDIAVFEANTVGFGASGRNGGWCMGLAEGVNRMLERPALRSRGLELMHAMQDTVDEVGRVSQAENIDCHFAKGGTLTVATTPHHVQRFRALVDARHELGFTEEDFRWLPEPEARRRIGTTLNLGAAYTSHCAAIHPARLVRGLGDTLRAKGVAIYEQTPVLAIDEGYVETRLGRVAAPKIIRATEGYTESIKGQSRQIMPLYSMMVATEPLPTDVWEEIGLHNRETFGDGRRVVIYGQRTLADRLAFGGRAGYYFGSRRKPVIASDDPQVARVERTLRSLFPVLRNHRITHGWGGLMGVPRTWRPCVTFDHVTGLGSAGGYTGEGVQNFCSSVWVCFFIRFLGIGISNLYLPLLTSITSCFNDITSFFSYGIIFKSNAFSSFFLSALKS